MMRWLMISIMLIALVLLSGCRVFVEPFVCLSGVCPSEESRLAAIPWNPSTLDKIGCQRNLDGSYQETGWLGNNKESNESLFRRFDFQLHRDDKNPREAGIQANYEVYQNIPSTLVEHTVAYAPIERVGKRYMKMPSEEKKVIDHDESAFYKSAVTSIKQQGSLLEITLMDAKGLAYKKSTLNLDHPQIGCVDGALVIRTMHIGGGNEGSLGSANAREMVYRKLPDGRLQIIHKSREWLLTPSSGLIGMNEKGFPSGTEPRKSEYTLIFPSARVVGRQ